jgi:uncharacterized protein (TIGR03435 family)
VKGMNVTRWVVLSMLASVAGIGQTPPPRLEFDVASVKAAPPPAGTEQINVGVQVDGAQVHCSNCSLKECIRIAYRLKDYQVWDRIGWLRKGSMSDAKLPAGAKREQVPEMLQTLLADRFGMKTHRETRDLPAYAIIVGKGGLKIKESPPDPAADNAAASGAAPINVTASGSRAGVSINLWRRLLLHVCEQPVRRQEAHDGGFGRFADSRYVDRPVVDMTGPSRGSTIRRSNSRRRTTSP